MSTRPLVEGWQYWSENDLHRELPETASDGGQMRGRNHAK